MKHPDVDMVAFTGDTSTGKEIMKMAADTLKKVAWSWAARARTSVFGDADLDRAVRGALNAASMFHAGQVCVAGTRMLVQESPRSLRRAGHQGRARPARGTRPG